MGLFVATLLPETKGKSLEEIAVAFGGAQPGEKNKAAGGGEDEELGDGLLANEQGARVS